MNQNYQEQLLREIQATPEEYLPKLLQIVRLFNESVTLNKAESSFRQGWREAQLNETRPIDELWDGIDAQ
jgi:hypothetical protein